MTEVQTKTRQIPMQLVDIEIVRQKHEAGAKCEKVKDTPIGQYHQIMATYFLERNRSMN